MRMCLCRIWGAESLHASSGDRQRDPAVLVLMAEAERGRRAENTGFLVQIGALGGLALVLALAIHLLRGSEPDAEDDVGP
jgi:hypothetical protein